LWRVWSFSPAQARRLADGITNLVNVVEAP
jgi:hypothetical protein